LAGREKFVLKFIGEVKVVSDSFHNFIWGTGAPKAA